MQMPFSMVLAQKLSTEKKVLYVNLMEHSGMLELLGVPGECDLGEVILALRRQRLTAETLGRGIHETEWMHYVEPFDNPEDLGEMTAGDLQELISFLEKQTSYAVSYTHLDVYKRQVGENRTLDAALIAQLRGFLDRSGVVVAPLVCEDNAVRLIVSCV